MPEETVQKTTVSYVDPFHALRRAPIEPEDLGARLQYKATRTEVDKETLTAKPVFEPYDLVEIVQQGKVMAGVDYMKHLLATGQAVPEDFYDDGKSGVDTTAIPSTIHEAKAMADQAEAEIQGFAKAAGANDKDGYSQQKLEELVSAKVKEIFEKQQAAVSSQNEGGNK